MPRPLGNQTAGRSKVLTVLSRPTTAFIEGREPRKSLRAFSIKVCTPRSLFLQIKLLTKYHNLPVLYQGNGATPAKFVKEELKPFYQQYVECHNTAGTKNPTPFPKTVVKPKPANKLRPWFQKDDNAFSKELEFDADGKMIPLKKGENVDLSTRI